MPKYQLYQSPLFSISGDRVRETMDMSLIKIFRAGPLVSLKGSPTVSPTTTALCRMVPLLFLSVSTNFLALSQAPPALDIVTARMKPAEMAPVKRPKRALDPRREPMNTG